MAAKKPGGYGKTPPPPPPSGYGRPPVFHYMVAIRETLARGDRAEIEQLLKAEKEVNAHYGGYDGLISSLEDALKRAK